MGANLGIRVSTPSAHSAATMPPPPSPMVSTVMSAIHTPAWTHGHIAIVVLSGGSCFINQAAEEKRRHQR